MGNEHYSKTKSPGLVQNILAILEIIFDSRTVGDALAQASAEPAAKKAKPAPQEKKTARKDRHTAQVPGGVGAAEVGAAQAAGSDPTGTGDLSISGLLGAVDLDRSALLIYIRKRYGNHSAVVIQILVAWEAYGELYGEWRAEWEEDTDAYRAKRALRLARCARDFQAALTSLSNYKQKSWYTHASVWIIWQQVWLYGNTWPLSTISLESRNARIKKIGIRFTNWRPLVAGYTEYSYKDRRSGQQINGKRRYNSSAVHQMLQRLALCETSWHTNSRFTAPDKLRLQTQLRSTLIKVEVADNAPSADKPTMLSEMASKL